MTIEKNAVKFSATQDKKQFAFDLELGGDVDTKVRALPPLTRHHPPRRTDDWWSCGCSVVWLCIVLRCIVTDVVVRCEGA